MIATRHENSFYRSVQEVPESLRQQLIETTNGENSGMIVIADRAGKEQWTEVVAHRESQQAKAAIKSENAEVPVRGLAGVSWATWAGVALFLAAGAMIASVFQVHPW
jgi:hypothetical protein